MRICLLLCLALLAVGCGDDDGPTGPSRTGSIEFRQVSPPSGTTITVSQGSPPGAFIPRGSGQLTIPLVIRSPREAPWAQLNVYLMAATPPGPDSYCGQNLPDSPTWGPFPPWQFVQYTVTGFQIYRLPCDVISIRAMLHLRQGGLLIPPNPSETLAEGTLPISFQLRP